MCMQGCTRKMYGIRRENANYNGRCETKISVFADDQWWTVYDEWDRKDCK